MKIYPRIFLILLLLVSISKYSYAQPHANFSMAGNRGCSPLVTHFTDISTGSPVSWHWVFDTHPGDTSNTRNPLWVYSTPGYYDVKLVVKNAAGQKDSITITHAVYVANQPTVRFIASDTILSCPPQTINFTNLSDTGGCSPYYTWFIDTAHIHTTNATYTFTVPGTYNITLRETDSCGCTGTLTKSAYILIDSLPIVSYSTPDTTPCTEPATVCFNNHTTGGFTYLWHFGDGISDTAANPCHVYTAAGSYSDTLIAYSAAGCINSLTKISDIRVGHVNFGFYTTPANLCTGNGFTCTDTSLTGPTHHLWRFSADPADVSTDAIPSFTYYTAGTHVIIDSVWDDYGCSGVVYDTINVRASPDATFTADFPYRCTPNDTVTFTPATTYPAGSVNYLWDFGDPVSGIYNSSTLAIPTHIYDSYSSYSVMLTMTDTAGCVTINSMGGYINIAPPWDTFYVNGLEHNYFSACLPDTISYTTYISPAVPYVVDSVVFGDGTYSTTPTGTHVYTTDGHYTMRFYYHLLGNGGCRYRSPYAVYASVGHPVTAISINATPDSLCPSTTLTLSGHCSTCTDSFWSLPGYASGDIMVDFSYRDSIGVTFYKTGWDKFIYYAYNYGCKDSILDSVYIKAPGANFAVTQPDCNVHNTIQCRVFSIPPPSTYYWLFGDGDTSTLPSPTHTYMTDGHYTITLYDTSYVTGCYNHRSQRIPIIPFPAGVVASDSVICKGQWVSFGDYHDFNTVITYGDHSGEVSPIYTDYLHLYADTGHYTVTMYLRNFYSCRDTLAYPSFIYVEEPTREIIASTPMGCAPLLVSFHDSDIAPTGIAILNRKWLWHTADTSWYMTVGPDTSHIYPEGTYTAYMIDSDANGCTSIDSVVINSVKPHAYFSAAYVDGCTNVAMPFFDTNTFVSYLWYWGDGSAPTAGGPRVYHTYTANGTYTDTVIITTTAGGLYPVGCVDTLIRANYVNISDTSMHLRFNLSDTLVSCPPLIVIATSAATPSTGNYYKWKFGFDSITINSTLANATAVYNYPGNYTITLIDSNIIGCIDSLKKQVHVGGPTGILTLSPDTVCAPGPVHLHLTNTSLTPLDSSYVWVAPPYGGFTTDTPGFIITYTTPGTYNPYVVIDSNGCQVIVHTHDSIYVYPISPISVNHPPVICGYSVQLIASGTPTYTWLPATGLSCTTCSSPIANPAAATMYSVVGINIYGCTDTQTTYVVIDTPKHITISGNAHVCLGICDTLKASGSNGSYFWSGAALSCYICDEVVVCPNATSNYTVVATDTLGCTDTGNFRVNVEPLPIIRHIPNPVAFCKDEPSALTATGAATYFWIPNKNISCDTCATPVILPVSNIVYTVTGTSIYGCKTTIEIPVTVIERTGSKIGNDTTICYGTSVELYTHGGIRYLWTNPYKLSNAYIHNPIASPDTTITYTVIVTENQCFEDTLHVKVTVAPIPIINVNPSYTIIAGSSIQLNGQTTNNVKAYYKWLPADDLSCSECPRPIATPTANTTYSVSVISVDGCLADTTFTVHMYCDNSQVFLPNTFTPNRDGVNDQFYVSSKGISIIKKLRVYDRWGEVVFERQNIQPNDPLSGWDGSFNGVELSPDAYVFVVEAVCELGEIFNYRGSISLIR